MTRNLAALLLGAALTAALLLGTDLALGRILGIPPSPGAFDAPERFRHPVLGYAPPAEPQHHRKEVDGHLAFDVTYHFDGHHRRRPPERGSPRAAERFALFFGGSNSFGEGLPYAETIPAVFESLRPRYRSYTYAYRGYGPQQMLARLEDGFAEGEIAEPSGAAVYPYFDYHHGRVHGIMSVVRWAGGKHPYYFLDGRGELKRDGTFASGRPVTTRLLWWLSKSAILKHYRVELPWRLDADDDRLFCAILLRSRELFEQRFPGSAFVVVIGPTSASGDPFVATCLEAEGFDPIDTRARASEIAAMRIPGDNHLSAAGARRVARALAERL